LNSIADEAKQLADIHEIQLSMTDKSEPKNNYGLEIQKIVEQFKKLGLSKDEVTEKTEKLTEAQAELQRVINSNEYDSIDAKNQAILNADKERSVALNQVKNAYEQAKLAYDKYMQPASKERITSTLVQVQNLLKNNTRVTKEVRAEWEGYVNRLTSGSNIAEKEIKDINLRIKETKAEMQQAGKLGVGFFNNLKSKMGSLTSYLSASAVLGSMVQVIRTGVSNIRELDTALVDLKKTAKMSASELYNFYLSANDTAKQMGTTTQAIIEQASAWSRLGFNTAEAATKMAKYSSMFATISPGMDLDSATDGLVSVMKAFKIGLDDTDEVVDGIMSKINIIGNTQAVNNGDIVDFLRRSSSAMAEANNTLEDTIALGTAMVEITRDAAGAGQVLKTISMRVRGYDEDTEEYIGDIEELSGKIADLTKTASTPGGISLFSDQAKTEYKSTRQLLQEISEIYDQLTDKNQAELLEALAGKRNGQAVAAILNNFDTVTSSLESMANSAGNAEAEMAIAMDSIDYKLNKVKETGTGIAQNLFNREDMKSVLDIINSLGNGLDWLTDKLDLSGTLSILSGFLMNKNGIGERTMFQWHNCTAPTPLKLYNNAI
ncbi:MAG: phage tail tape measure protein, partial [Clostridium sp.]|nr:phage tail tape measure protein [Clostridium sp.]